MSDDLGAPRREEAGSGSPGRAVGVGQDRPTPPPDLLERLSDFEEFMKGPAGDKYSAELLHNTIKEIRTLRESTVEHLAGQWAGDQITRLQAILRLVAYGTKDELLDWSREHKVPESMVRKYFVIPTTWEKTSDLRGARIYILQALARSAL